MNKAIIGIHYLQFESCIAALHEAGIIEITDIREKIEETGDLTRNNPDPVTLSRLIATQVHIGQIRDKMLPFAQEKKGIITSLLSPGKKTPLPANPGLIPQTCALAEDFIHDTKDFLNLYQDYQSTLDRIEELTQAIETLTLLLKQDINPDYLVSSRFSDIIAGTIQSEDLSFFQELIQSKIQSGLITATSEEGEKTLVVVCAGAHEHEALQGLLRPPLFQRIVPQKDLSGKPSRLLPEKREELALTITRKEEQYEHLSFMVKARLPEVQALYEELSLQRARMEMTRRSGITRDVIFIEGFFPEKNRRLLNAILQRHAGDQYLIRILDPEKTDTIPVQYNNPKWLKPFEFLTTMYAPPRYNEIDPTPFIAPVFLLFFGLMLGDAGYGLVLLVIGTLLYRGIGQQNRSVGDMCIVLIGCAIASIICGIMEGGWFGDILPRFFGITPPLVLLDPMRSPILFFQLALIIGIIHINLGLVLGLWQNYRKKMVRLAIRDQGIWFIIQPAAAILLIQFFGWRSIPSWMAFLAGIMLLFSIGILLLGKGPMAFFDLTGFLGDWLSYVRILALALATGGIAMAINLLAGMIAAIHPLLFIPAIIFLVLGQTFNLVIQALGGVIHSLRLHYIEFFGKFYSGGGKLFHPFKAERIYTTLPQDDELSC
ncbi:MAG: V-type ATP synthase subunit I [Methanospirillaceae archaeon]|nr:V-type ATP synthase subunit I [Methanospirillaceae archaeon]